MAESDLQKSVQDIKDPEARKKAYYSEQRIRADRGATTNAKSADTAAKISAKQGNKAKAKEYTTDSENLKKYGVLGVAANVLRGPLSSLSAVGENAIGGPEGSATKSVGSALAKRASGAISKFIPEAESAVGGGLKALEGKASQMLGKARPTFAGAEKKALTSKASSTKALPKPKETSDWAKAGMKAGTKGKVAGKAAPRTPSNMAKAVNKDAGKLKPSGKASSSPVKRDSLMAQRVNPKTGKQVGKQTTDIVTRSSERQLRKGAAKDTADMNKAASDSTKNPRSRVNRNTGSDTAAGKRGSSRKGNYKPAKLKANSPSKD